MSAIKKTIRDPIPIQIDGVVKILDRLEIRCEAGQTPTLPICFIPLPRNVFPKGPQTTMTTIIKKVFGLRTW
jgi:hypothetical protein